MSLTSGQELEIEIDRLGAKGDGIADHSDAPIFVERSLPGERWRVRLVKRSREGWRAKPLLSRRLVERNPPLCCHFEDCGGCSLQHLTSVAYRSLKVERILKALRQRQVSYRSLEPLFSSGAGTRRRVRLAFDKNGSLGYRARSSHRIVRLNECPIAVPAIERLIPLLAALSQQLRSMKRGGEWMLTGANNGLEILVSMEEPGLQDRERIAQFTRDLGIVRVSWQQGKSMVPETIVQHAAPRLEIGNCSVELPPGAFLQATRGGERALQKFAISAVGRDAKVIDLYAGLGTFSLALLALTRKVVAFEIDSAMVNALRRASRGQVLADTRNLIERPIEAKALDKFDIAILDPPRRGAIEQVREIVESTLTDVIYASCDPGSFARDAQALCADGFVLDRLLPVDQFVYASEIELIAQFRRD